MEENKYKALFDANKKLLDLVERRTKLIKLRQETHQNLYNTTTAIEKIQLDLKNIMTELEEKLKRKRGGIPKDFIELDKIVYDYYGKKSSTEIIAIAAEKGITTDAQQIDYRRRTLKIIKLSQKGNNRENNGFKDYTEIDKIIKKHYGKINSTGISIIAAKKGITINLQQINNRRKALGIAPAGIMGRSKKKKKQTEEEDLKLIEEASNINLKGLDGNKDDLKDIQSEAELGEENCYEQ